jgi:hypothetical protein
MVDRDVGQWGVICSCHNLHMSVKIHSGRYLAPAIKQVMTSFTCTSDLTFWRICVFEWNLYIGTYKMEIIHWSFSIWLLMCLQCRHTPCLKSWWSSFNGKWWELGAVEKIVLLPIWGQYEACNLFNVFNHSDISPLEITPMLTSICFHLQYGFVTFVL